jgi:hypothetical protein
VFNWRQLKLVFKLRGLLRAGNSGDVRRVVGEVFKDAPEEVRRVVDGILSVNLEGKSPREIAKEIGIRLGIREEDLDDFVDTVVAVAEEVREYLKPRE